MSLPNESNRTVLAIMPHPDDIELLCAGTLIRLRAAGWDIHCATMTAGDKGSASLQPAEISAIRRSEAAAAASVLGSISYSCLEFEDLSIVFDNVSRRRVAGLLRRIRPAIVLTTPPADYMFDHEITSHLVRDACFNAAVPNYCAEGESAAIEDIPYLYYSDALAGTDIFGQPAAADVVIDISLEIELKAKALACHDSQRSWLRSRHGIDDYIDAMMRWSAIRGAEIGVAYGEAFRCHAGHPHPQSNLLAHALPPRTGK